MNYAYFIENTDNENYINNSAVFRLVQDLDIEEEQVYIDTKDSREELENLMDIIEYEDRLVIRSVIDLANDAKELLDVLEELQDKEVILCSSEEDYLNGTNYYTALRGFSSIHRHYLEKRREQGYEKAKELGKIGRPKKAENIEKAIRLYKTKAFKIGEIEKMSGVSSSTLYRELKLIDK